MNEAMCRHLADVTNLAMKAVENPTLLNLIKFSLADRDIQFYAPQKPSVRLPKDGQWHARTMGAKIYSSTMVQCRMAVWEVICRLGSVDMWSYDEGMEDERYLHPLMYLGDDQFLIDTEEDG